ncbi:MAG: alpha-galactosidase [Odoribacteraceae bacterium]|jgi:alpha-galactosidase|nr:alpha-galactosidase [Odoribacteraceae bacterium]
MSKNGIVKMMLIIALSLPAGAQERVPLGKLNLRLMTTGYGNARANRSVDNHPLTLRGEVHEGVGTHADSKLIVALDGKATRFTALAGVDDEVGRAGSVVFRVTVDGEVAFTSPLMRPGDEPARVDVSLEGARRLVLEALSGGDGITSDHADWASAFIETRGERPTALPDAELIDVSAGDLLLTLAVDGEKNLFQQYIGRAGGLERVFARGERRDQAYPTVRSDGRVVYWGEPALHVLHADGHLSTVLKYAGCETGVQEDDPNVTLTRVMLKDPNYPLRVDLVFKAYRAQHVVEQWAEIFHEEPAPVVVKEFASAALTLRARDYWLTQFTGDWASEFGVDEYPLTVGSKVLENKWGITSANGRQPHFMVSLDGAPSETSGEVLAGSLAWSGNFRLQFERATSGQLTVIAGMNPWSADYTLPAGQCLATPSLVYTYSANGKGEASRNLHRWGRAYGTRDGDTLLRTVFNNWEATGMNTADATIIPFLRPAHELGFELFLLDDGWFGLENKARVLGEWMPTPLMHPKGMTPIIRAAERAGIDFGLWVEMEMANPAARLVTEHPDWLLTEPGRAPHLQRGQYVLDLCNPEVQAFCIAAFNKILKDYPGISFVKWDCNSPFHNPYSSYLGERQQHLWYDYTRGLYRVFEACVAANPRLQMMLCSAGGARCDYGALRFFHEFWTSDNTTPLRRVFIQWGASHVFPARVQGAHVTHMGRQPFKFAFDVAMSGVLGMDADPTRMTGEEKGITVRAVEAYKSKLRPVVQLGDLYRLVSPYESSRSVVSFVDGARERAVLFVYQVNDDAAGGLQVRLQGLDAGKTYVLEEVNIASPGQAACRENGQRLSGKRLMEEGVRVDCEKRFDSAAIYLHAE